MEVSHQLQNPVSLTQLPVGLEFERLTYFCKFYWDVQGAYRRCGLVIDCLLTSGFKDVPIPKATVAIH